jgi:hypothetical protein
MNLRVTAFTLLASMVALSACNQSGAQVPSVKREQSKKAIEAAQSLSFTDNAEIDNIKKRIENTSKPGQLGFIILLNSAGQPILYEGVVGKVTSGSKRLTPPTDIVRRSAKMDTDAFLAVPAPSDEGTYGSSGEYIFYWNTDGVYRQWNGSYLYSDQPLRLSVEPLVVNVAPVEQPVSVVPAPLPPKK